MLIRTKEDGHLYRLTMRLWEGNKYTPDHAEDLIIDDSFKWNREDEAWQVEGSIDNIQDWLEDWINYYTEYDLTEHDSDELKALREEAKRTYELSRIQ